MKPILTHIETMSNRHRKQIENVHSNNTNDGIHLHGTKHLSTKRIVSK